MMDTLNIELGFGDKIITDIYDDIEHEWAGIAISNGKCETGAKTVEELNPILTIKSGDTKSIDVLIAALERAKTKIKKPNYID